MQNFHAHISSFSTAAVSFSLFFSSLPFARVTITIAIYKVPSNLLMPFVSFLLLLFIFGAQYLAILTHRTTTRRRWHRRFNSCCPLCIIRHWQNNLCAFASVVSVVVIVVVAVAFFCHGHLAFYAYALDQKKRSYICVCVCTNTRVSYALPLSHCALSLFARACSLLTFTKRELCMLSGIHALTCALLSALCTLSHTYTLSLSVSLLLLCFGVRVREWKKRIVYHNF